MTRTRALPPRATSKWIAWPGFSGTQRSWSAEHNVYPPFLPLTSCQHKEILQCRLPIFHALGSAIRSGQKIHPLVSGCERRPIYSPWGWQ
jgi:hypothetical protein